MYDIRNVEDEEETYYCDGCEAYFSKNAIETINGHDLCADCAARYVRGCSDE